MRWFQLEIQWKNGIFVMDFCSTEGVLKVICVARLAHVGKIIWFVSRRRQFRLGKDLIDFHSCVLCAVFPEILGILFP